MAQVDYAPRRVRQTNISQEVEFLRAVLAADRPVPVETPTPLNTLEEKRRQALLYLGTSWCLHRDYQPCLNPQHALANRVEVEVKPRTTYHL